MIGVGSRVPPGRVWPAPRGEPVEIASVTGARSALLLFYLYDWSST